MAMRFLETDCRAWLAGVNAVLIAGVVFLAGVWAGQRSGRGKAEDLPRGAEAAQAPAARPRAVPAPVEATAVSFDDSFADFGVRAPPESAWEKAPVAPALNMRETPAGYEITVSLTGVHPNDLRIRSEPGRSVLVIQADLKHPATGKISTTEGRLRIPRDARLEAATSTWEDGHLFIMVPK